MIVRGQVLKVPLTRYRPDLKHDLPAALPLLGERAGVRIPRKTRALNPRTWNAVLPLLRWRRGLGRGGPFFPFALRFMGRGNKPYLGHSVVVLTRCARRGSRVEGRVAPVPFNVHHFIFLTGPGPKFFRLKLAARSLKEKPV